MSSRFFYCFIVSLKLCFDNLNLAEINLFSKTIFFLLFYGWIFGNIANDVEAQTIGVTTKPAKCDDKPLEKPKSDPIQSAMGEFGRWHLIVCSAIFLLKFPVAWHQMSIIFMAPNVEFTCADKNITDACSANCTAYEYNRSVFTETLQMTWDLVCQRKHLANASQTIFMFGILVGNILFGTLADK